MSHIVQVWEFWAGKIPVKIINFHSFTPDAQAYNQLRRTQRKPSQLTWIYVDIILPCIAICCLCIIQRPPRRLGILQGLHEGWCRPGYRTSRISQGLSDLTIWTLRRSGKHEKKEMEIWNVSLFCIFCHFFCTCVFNCPRPCRLDTKSVYSWII